MNRADGVTDTSLNRFTAFFYSFNSGFNIAKIIEGIKYPEYINSNLYRLFDKPLDNIVGIMSVTYSVLPSQ